VFGRLLISGTGGILNIRGVALWSLAGDDVPSTGASRFHNDKPWRGVRKNAIADEKMSGLRNRCHSLPGRRDCIGKNYKGLSAF